MSQPELNFEWDPEKAASNSRKHGITFERAATVFLDANALTIFDGKHSDDEDRWITLGLDKQGVLVVVCHTWRAEAENADAARCRIISARKASKREARSYTNRT
jgi:uncharacterized protein